jgi:hypothetical protein
MSHTSLDSVAHTIAAFGIIVSVLSFDSSGFVHRAKELSLREQELQICGSKDSGLLNLTEALAASKPQLRQRLNQGFAHLKERIAESIESNNVPRSDHCQHSLLGKTYTAPAYRLNGIDEPNRKVNWSYRIVAKEEI